MSNVLVEWYGEDGQFEWAVLAGTATDLRIDQLRRLAPGRVLPSWRGVDVRCHTLVSVRASPAAATHDVRVDAFTNDLHRQRPRA